MARKRERVFALTAAILFLLTSVGFTGMVIWQMSKDNKAMDDTSTKKPAGLQGTQLAGFEPIASVTELQKTDLIVGTGAEAKSDSSLVAHYTGAVASTGKIFQSSHDSGQPLSFELSGVIAGWTEGVPGMKVGGKRRLVIPAEKAYGTQSPSADVPPNSALVFDIELVAVK